jgi:hypothetical protein
VIACTFFNIKNKSIIIPLLITVYKCQIFILKVILSNFSFSCKYVYKIIRNIFYYNCNLFHLKLYGGNKFYKIIIFVIIFQKIISKNLFIFIFLE